MKTRDAARWIELYRLAELETDPEKFLAIVTEVNRMINEEERIGTARRRTHQ